MCIPQRPIARLPTIVRSLPTFTAPPPHGVPGPWVILGYRAGREAARYLEIDRGHAWDVQVVHHAPPKVQYTCMMDGFMAATGASPGKLNLRLDPVDAEDQISTEISRIVDGKTRTLRISYPTSIRDQIRNVDYADFPQWADRLDRMSDDELFEVAEPPSQR